jgi:hypothetical protein
MKLLLLIPVFLLVSLFGYSQDTLEVTPRVYQKNSIYFELFGNALIYGSLNYERIVLHRKFFYLSVRAGIGGGYIPKATVFSFPLMVNTIFQVHKGGSVELGTGATMMFMGIEDGEANELGIWENGNAPIPTGTIGYRYQAKKGFLLRVNFTPFTNFEEFFYFVGISFGYSFNGKKH